MSDPKYIVSGGKKLRGEVSIGGAKNATWKLMIGAILSNQDVVIKNAARILDVDIAANIIRSLGGSVDWLDETTIKVNGSGLNKYAVDSQYGSFSRASLLFLGPLLARFGQAQLPLPGGDKIAARPIERHIEGYKALGAEIKIENETIFAKVDGLKGAHYQFNKNSHTGTENLILGAVLAEGETTLENAAEEPEIDDLIDLVNLMGAKVVRDGRTLKIKGVTDLTGAEVLVIPDRNQAVTFACAALLTKGDIIIKDIKARHLTFFLEKLTDIGAGWQVLAGESDKTYSGKKLDNLRVFYKGYLKATDVTTAIYPGFMSDWQAIWGVLMTQAEGKSTIHETIFENRFAYTEILTEMGAKIELFDPDVPIPEQTYNFNLKDAKAGSRAAAITGSTTLKPINYEVTDLRAGATVVLAALTADGQSTITGINQIERGYQDFEQKLEKLGADIRKTES